MTYAETISYLYQAAPLFQHVGGAAYKEGLTTTYTLDEHFNHPHQHYRTIHVAGTNGKGSCAHTIAAMLQHHGLKVGLYTSPHLVDFRERIRVNGEMIPEQRVVDFVENERSFFEPLHPSFFELTTALALQYFAEEGVDVAVIEVGLGGRMDCTNIIRPVLSVITNISLDHTQFLGDTLSQIAAEKAGIIKQGVPVIVGEALPETRPVFESTAAAVKTSITFAEDSTQIIDSAITAQGLRRYTTRDYGTFEGELVGTCQIKNTNTLLCAAPILAAEFGVTIADIHAAFRKVCSETGLQGRWQVIRREPTVVCDTGHNVGGWQYIGKQLSDIARTHRVLHVVFGMANDKDIDAVIAMLPLRARYYWTKASVRRAMSEENINRLADKRGLHGKLYATVAQAYKQAVLSASPDDFIYVGGSSFVVADLLTYLQDAEK